MLVVVCRRWWTTVGNQSEKRRPGDPLGNLAATRWDESRSDRHRWSGVRRNPDWSVPSEPVRYYMQLARELLHAEKMADHWVSHNSWSAWLASHSRIIFLPTLFARICTQAIRNIQPWFQVHPHLYINGMNFVLEIHSKALLKTRVSALYMYPCGMMRRHV